MGLLALQIRNNINNFEDEVSAMLFIPGDNKDWMLTITDVLSTFIELVVLLFVHASFSDPSAWEGTWRLLYASAHF